MAGFEPEKIHSRLRTPIVPPSVAKETTDTVLAFENPKEIPKPESETKIIKVKLDDLLDFQNHPFSRGTDEKMQELAQSIEQNGIISPPIVRPAKMEIGKYELLAGHRRRDACAMIGLEEIEVVYRDVDDDTAALIMVSSNLEQRDKILPVEKGYAYKIMVAALKRQGKRTDLTSAQVVPKLEARDQVAKETGENRMAISRYIRLTELIKPLQERTNANHIGFVPAVDLSYLTRDEQGVVESTIISEGLSISGSMAKKLKDLSREGRLSKEGIVNEEMILYVMTEKAESVIKDIKLPVSRFQELLPEKLRERPLTTEQSAAILEEAMALFREKYEQELGVDMTPEPVYEDEDEEEFAL